MTGFTTAAKITTGPHIAIDKAREKMRRHNGHLLVAIDEDCKIVGKVTAMEIDSEKPVQIAQNRRVECSEIRIKDIMTPQPVDPRDRLRKCP